MKKFLYELVFLQEKFTIQNESLGKLILILGRSQNLVEIAVGVASSMFHSHLSLSLSLSLFFILYFICRLPCHPRKKKKSEEEMLLLKEFKTVMISFY